MMTIMINCEGCSSSTMPLTSCCVVPHYKVSTAVAGKMRDKETQQRMGAAVGQYGRNFSFVGEESV